MFEKYSNVEAILSVDSNNGLAKNCNIPWKNKKDIKFFKEKTINNIVIMGSKTLLSLPNSMPLRDRTNIVVTNNSEKYSNIYKNNTNIFFLDLDQTLQLIKINKHSKFFIIGGNEIYNLLLHYCSRIWLTKIKENYNCDIIFNYDISTYTKEVIYEDNEMVIMCLQ